MFFFAVLLSLSPTNWLWVFEDTRNSTNNNNNNNNNLYLHLFYYERYVLN